ncbi:MAG: hypothetical protein JXR94_03615, partial [Candidatus Hydrogenedentes bacterium]|nr:hypothetical protein [Candidatus Hydrogenedentota bacterium]
MRFCPIRWEEVSAIRRLPHILAAVACIAALGGCTGDDAPVAAPSPSAPDRPAPGSMVLISKTPLEAQEHWEEIWSSFLNLERCTPNVFGLKRGGQDAQSGQFDVVDLDNYITFSFDASAFEAARYCRFRVHLPESQHAGFWWARAGDIKPGEYPMDIARFKSCQQLEPGVFEVDLSLFAREPEWAGPIRMLRIDPYGTPGGTVTITKLEAQVAGDAAWVPVSPSKALLRGDGAVRAASLLMRAKTTCEIYDLRAVTDLWYTAPWYASAEARAELDEFGTAQGLALLDADGAPASLEVFSAVGRGMGDVVGYLHDLHERLDAAVAARLWPGEPCLILEDFTGAEPPQFAKWAEQQGRELIASGLDDKATATGGRSAFFEVSASSQEGASAYGVAVNIPLSPKPFALRVRYKEKVASEPALRLNYYFPGVKRGAGTEDTDSV